MAKKIDSGSPEVAKLSEKQKKYYDALMAARKQIVEQMEFHSGEALANNQQAGEKGMSTHMADLGSDNFLHSMELDLMTQEGDIVETIDEAIERLINDEDYGICQDCGCDIGEERLMVKPYATFCVKCKSIREKNGGTRPDYD